MVTISPEHKQLFEDALKEVKRILMKRVWSEVQCDFHISGSVYKHSGCGYEKPILSGLIQMLWHLRPAVHEP